MEIPVTQAPRADDGPHLPRRDLPLLLRLRRPRGRFGSLCPFGTAGQDAGDPTDLLAQLLPAYSLRSPHVMPPLRPRGRGERAARPSFQPGPPAQIMNPRNPTPRGE